MPYLVREHLFIGDISAAAEVLQRGSTEFTHVLSLLSSASISFFSDWRPSVAIHAEEIRKGYFDGDGTDADSAAPRKLLYSLERAGAELKLVRMAVPLRDMENEDLLDYLDVCLDFIDESRKQGSVLVHCFAGVSRRSQRLGCEAGDDSDAAVITAYLMRSERLSQEDALESLRQSCEFICPNDGFLEQLKMFEEMGFEVHFDDIPKGKHGKHYTYLMTFSVVIVGKKFIRLGSSKGARPMRKGDSYNRGERINSSRFAADPALPTESPSSKEASTGDKPTVAYRCKKCRRVVALQDHVVTHTPGEGETCFEWQKRRSGNPFNRSEEIECSSLFVEPLRWVQPYIDHAMPYCWLDNSSHLTSDIGTREKLKKAHWKASSHVHIVMLAWATSIGQAFNAAVAVGSPRHFSSIKVKLT
ncbi:hypothetical protein ACLOJK_024826 [Asimina triloba]